jgi:hypothetical protein
MYLPEYKTVFLIIHLKDGDHVITTKLSMLYMGIFMKTEGCERELAYVWVNVVI